MFTKFISVDGYLVGQITEACIFLSPAKSFSMLTQQILLSMEKRLVTVTVHEERCIHSKNDLPAQQ